MADANHTRIFGGNEPQSETPVMDLHRDWQSYQDWLDGPDCAEMDDDEFAQHVDALTRLERRIVRAPSVSAQDLAAQIQVLTANWQDTACFDGLRSLVAATGQASNRRVTA